MHGIHTPEAHWYAAAAVVHAAPVAPRHISAPPTAEGAQVVVPPQSAASSQNSPMPPTIVHWVPLRATVLHTSMPLQSAFSAQLSPVPPGWPQVPARQMCSHCASAVHGPLPSGSRQVPLTAPPDLTHLASPRQSSTLSHVVLGATQADKSADWATHVPAHWLLAVHRLLTGQAQALATQPAAAVPPLALGHSVFAQSAASSHAPPRAGS